MNKLSGETEKIMIERFGKDTVIALETIENKNLIHKLQDKDDKRAYELTKQIGDTSAASDEYYLCFEDFLSLINKTSSYVRTRSDIDEL